MPQVPMAAPELEENRLVSLTELHFKLLEEFSPGSVLIDKDDNIVHLSERAERYLHLGGGEAHSESLACQHHTRNKTFGSAVGQKPGDDQRPSRLRRSRSTGTNRSSTLCASVTIK